MRAATGIEAHRFDLDDDYTGLDAAGLEALSGATHVLATVPPIADGDRDPLLALHGERRRLGRARRSRGSRVRLVLLGR